jgi:DNA-binding MltR family transcriptional regulator
MTHEPPPSEVGLEFIKYLQSNFAIVAGSVLEDMLEAALRGKMRDDLSAALKERLFSGYGPLSTFSGKIDIAFAFSLFDVQIYNDLRAIKDIRNKFAHTSEFLNFSSPELERDAQKLTGWAKDCDVDTLFKDRFSACANAIKQQLNNIELINALRNYKRPDASPDKSS